MLQAEPFPLHGLIEHGVRSFGEVRVELDHKAKTAKIAGRRYSLEQVDRILTQLARFGYRVKRSRSLFGLGTLEYATVSKA